MRTLLTALLIAACAGSAHAAPEQALRVLLLTGGHGFEEKPFLAVFEEMDGVNFTHVALEKKDGFLPPSDKTPYDVIVMYNMSAAMPQAQRAHLLQRLKDGAGLVSFHHAIANYPDWPEYNEIIGARYFLASDTVNDKEYPRSEYTHDIDIPVHVEDASHPITKGVTDFIINDESYFKWKLYPGNNLILSTTHPKSEKALCWTRDYKGAPVCFLQLGHGPLAYANPSFQKVLRQAIQWTAKKREAHSESKK
jgi:uncharacterized protein